jgi:hypothetical protein
VTALVGVAQREGWLGSLVVAALESRPASAPLHAFGEPFGLSVAPITGQLDALLVDGWFWGDPTAWRARLGPLEVRVCRITVGSAEAGLVHGTGFLVGPDIVLTAHSVVADLVAGRAGPRNVSLLFDYRRLPDGVTVSPGTTYRLSERRWLVDASPHASGDETPEPSSVTAASLDYALLRVAGAPGSEPVGGDRAEPGAAARGWIELSQAAEPKPDSPLLVLHHPAAGALAASLGRVVDMTGDGTRLRYRTDTAPGSAGAPCMDASLNLVAMHQSREAEGVGVGLRMSVVAPRLEELGLLVSLDRRTV